MEDKALAAELYRQYRGEMFDNFKLHQSTLQHHLAFTVAVLGATMAASTKLAEAPWLGPVLVAVPLLNCYICFTAIRTCRRYYVGTLERIAIISKLEGILGLDKPLRGRPSEAPPLAFPRDRYLLPERWLRTVNQFSSTDEFVEQSSRAGVNLLAKRSFQFLIGLNLLLSGSILWALLR